MSNTAQMAIWLSEATRFWPFGTQRAKLQMHAMGLAFDTYLRDQRASEAAALIPEYLKLQQAVFGPDPKSQAGAVCMSRRAEFGRVLHESGGKEEGKAMVQQSVDWFQQHPAEEDAVWCECLLILGGALILIQCPLQGIEWVERARQLRQRVHGPNSFEVAQCHNDLGVAYQKLGQLEAAEHAQREALRLHEMAQVPGRGVAMALNNLSATLNKAGRPEEAQQLSLRAIELVKSDEELLTGMLDTLANHYEAIGNFEQAITTRANAISLAIGQNQLAKVMEFGTRQAALMDRLGRTEEAARCRETMAAMRRQAED